MKSTYASEDAVVADLGDKVIAGLAFAVARTRSDLSVYRRTFPGWVADHTERGLLGWCHDRIWRHLLEVFEGVDAVSFVDRAPLREMYVGTRYRLRLKKHGAEDRIGTYPTEAALAFLEQETMTLDGLEEVRLIAGYRWDAEQRTVGAGVLSLRDGNSNVVWTHVLSEPADTSFTEATPIVPPSAGPRAPEISLPAVDERSVGAEGTESE